MTVKPTKALRLVLLMGLLAVSAFLIAGPSTQAGPIAANDKAAYTALAGQVPREASFVALAANMERSLQTIDRIMLRYAQTDPMFKYNQMMLSIKGPLGFNPLKADELKQAGLNLEKGLAVFAFRQDGVPLIVFGYSDKQKLRARMDMLASQIGEATAVVRPDKKKLAEMILYTSDGTMEGQLKLAAAMKDGRLLLMVMPESLEWFDKHVEAALALNEQDSLAKDKNFLKLLGRLEADTCFVSYNNYAQYIKDLRKGAEKLKAKMSERAQATGEGSNPLAFLDSLLSLAESFSAQIFAVSLTETDAGFVHEIIGDATKVKAFKDMFTIGKKRQFKSLPMGANPIGSIYATVNFEKFHSQLVQGGEVQKSFDEWNAKLKTESGVDIKNDIYGNLTGEMAGLFYGISPIPPEMAQAQRVSQSQIASLANLVFVAGLKQPEQTVALLKQTKQTMEAAGDTVDVVKNRSFAVLHHINVNGMDLYLGVKDHLYVLGIGKNSIDAAFGKPGKLNLVESPDVVAHLKMDFAGLSKAMENLKPPADSVNTQLFQQYQVWSTQIAGKLEFLHVAEAKAVHTPLGFRTSGRLTF